ncbi:hypothetical protein WISP_60855 [Willisornis vidua]|uniref:Uncharacterized protein n=1 Tax=Willisornis vidua TaxID=1566151 RepID=A0ABQ9DGS1_9PASS|nr:hypothetical protein WISP_60855 [Willisornis vidua]
MVKTMVRNPDHLQEVHGGEDSHLQPMEDSMPKQGPKSMFACQNQQDYSNPSNAELTPAREKELATDTPKPLQLFSLPSEPRKAQYQPELGLDNSALQLMYIADNVYAIISFLEKDRALSDSKHNGIDGIAYQWMHMKRHCL